MLRAFLDIILSTVPFLLACMVSNTEERNAALRFSMSGGKPMPPCLNGASSMKRARRAGAASARVRAAGGGRCG
jgi:hypothetical protein